MKSIITLLCAILALANTTINASESTLEQRSYKEAILTSASFVQCVIDNKIYVNADQIEFNEDGVEFQLDEMTVMCLPYVCVDNHGAFITLDLAMGAHLYKCTTCGRLFCTYSPPIKCDNCGGRSFRQVMD